MEGNPSGTLEQQVAYLLTQVSSLAQANQELTTALDAQTQKLLLLEASVQGEVGNLTTNQESLQTILNTHSQSLSNETAARGVVDNGLTVEVIDLKDQHLNDHTYLIGLVEEHHGEWMAASASHTGAMIAEQQARLVGDETNASRIESVRTELVSKVDALDAEVATYNDVLDFTTIDTLDLTMDSDYPLDWSVLSASQEWRFEIDGYLAQAQSVINAKFVQAEQSIAEANQIAAQALQNTDITQLQNSLMGNIGSAQLDAVLQNKLNEASVVAGQLAQVETDLRSLLAARMAETQEQLDTVSSGLTSETNTRIDSLAAEAYNRSQEIILRTSAIQGDVTQAINQLDAYMVANDAAMAGVLSEVNAVTTSQSAIASQFGSMQAYLEVPETADNATLTTDNVTVAASRYNYYAVQAIDREAATTSVEKLKASVDSSLASMSEFIEVVVKDQLTTQVTAINETVTQLNGQITTVTETVSSIDGVQGMKAVSIDNNGVITGYGLVSELKNGQVTSAFGVDADQFFVGNPLTGRKVFAVTTSDQVVNGVTYPSGTWIDVANIAAATIGDAHIKELNADKLNAGTIQAARIGVGTITADKLNVTSLSALSASIGTLRTATEGARTEISDNQFRVFDANGVERIFIGVR